MKKKFLLWIMTIIVFAVVLIGYGYYNLKSNSVYYAKNTPHKEGTEPVLMMLVDNLDWIYNPDIEGIKYDFDGKPIILTFDRNNKQLGYVTISNLHGKRGYLFSHENLIFRFNSKFALISASDSRNDYKDIDISTLNDVILKKDIYGILKPIIDKQTKPLINLQWLFDIVYKDRFN